MKTLIILAILGYAGYHAYMYLSKPSAALVTYQKFADAMRRGQHADAGVLATGAEKSKIEELLRPKYSPPLQTAGNPGVIGRMWQEAMSPQAMEKIKRDMIQDLAGNIEGITYDVDSEETGEDKSKISATQKVHYSGTSSNRAFTKQHRQTAELIKEGELWKISSFSDQDK